MEKGKVADIKLQAEPEIPFAMESRIEEVFDEEENKEISKELIEETSTEDASGINIAGYVVPDHYESYLHTLAPGQQWVELTVAKESHVLRSILMHVSN